jgi:hypothetical protein
LVGLHDEVGHHRRLPFLFSLRSIEPKPGARVESSRPFVLNQFLC